MKKPKTLQSIFQHYVKWIFLSSLIGVGCGVASTIFLRTLELTTEFREAHSWLLFLLPLGGLIVGGAYHYWGKSVEAGNNLIIDEFHDLKNVVPFRMAPLVLFGTLATHLFGGSAGREGTAVQMGGSIADQFTRIFKMTPEDRRTLLMAGMAGGFGSVFGVPFAGTIFGLEVLAIGKLHLWALVECATAAFTAHYVTQLLGVHHTSYVHPTLEIPNSFVFWASVTFAGVLFGLTAKLFALMTEQIKASFKKIFPYLPIRALIGGAFISLVFFLVPLTTRYAGLGVSIIVDALKAPLPAYDWIGKLTFTAFTLGVGFKGGEVTPLLFIGAALGNALSGFLPIPLPILAVMGFVAVFAGAANTPLACTIMALELFGPQIGIYALVACFVSYAVSGHRGIYHAQRVHKRKNSRIILSLVQIGVSVKRVLADPGRRKK